MLHSKEELALLAQHDKVLIAAMSACILVHEALGAIAAHRRFAERLAQRTLVKHLRDKLKDRGLEELWDGLEVDLTKEQLEESTGFKV
jgi:hypothetical protein